MEDDTQETWTKRRREAAAVHAERLARDQALETQQAEALVSRFTAEAVAAGLPTEELKAVDPDGRRYRTGVQGWMLRKDQRSGIGADGQFYFLGFIGGMGARLAARVRGVRLTPSEPPLIMGRGGRDGESMPLADVLDRRLGGGTGP